MCSYLVGKGGSEMKRIQKDYKVKMHILLKSANHNVVIVGERNDEDQAVPSVMKLIEKLIVEEVGEMILETGVDDTRCSEQIVAVPVPRIAERIVAVVTRTSRCSDRQRVRTHTRWWSKSSKILNLPQQVANAQDAKMVSRHDPAVNQ